MSYYNRPLSLGSRREYDRFISDEIIINGDKIHSIRTVQQEDFYQTLLLVYLESSFFYDNSCIKRFENFVNSQRDHASFRDSYENMLEIIKRLRGEGVDYLDNSSTDQRFIKAFHDLSQCFSPFDNSPELYLRKVAEKLWVSIYFRKESGQIFKIIRVAYKFSISVIFYNGLFCFLYPIQTNANNCFYQKNCRNRILASCGCEFSEDDFRQNITNCPHGHELYSVEKKLLNRNELKRKKDYFRYLWIAGGIVGGIFGVIVIIYFAKR